jgi:hypothetical protein
MAQYRYLFADLLSNQIIAELPLTGVNFTQQLNAAGTLTGHLLLSGVNSNAMNVPAGTIPGRTALYVDRDGVLVWGGIIWNRSYTSSNQTLSLQAREFESYFERRRITSTVAFNNTDQLAIVQSIVNTAQTATNGNIGLTVGTETSGVLVSRTYYGYEYKTVFSAIQDLSRSSQGFDFNILIAYDSNGNPSKTLRLAYPRYGKVYSATSTTQAVLDLPSGNIVEYEYAEDAITAANTVYALGAGSNEGKLISTQTDPTKITAGWPLLEEQANYSDITDSTLLTNLASSQVKTVSYPPITMKVVLPTYVDPILGSYEVGDDIRVRITDDRFPTGLDTYYRLVAYNVTVGENGPERVTMTLTISSY